MSWKQITRYLEDSGWNGSMPQRERAIWCCPHELEPRTGFDHAVAGVQLGGDLLLNRIERDGEVLAPHTQLAMTPLQLDYFLYSSRPGNGVRFGMTRPSVDSH